MLTKTLNSQNSGQNFFIYFFPRFFRHLFFQKLKAFVTTESCVKQPHLHIYSIFRALLSIKVTMKCLCVKLRSAINPSIGTCIPINFLFMT